MKNRRVNINLVFVAVLFLLLSQTFANEPEKESNSDLIFSHSLHVDEQEIACTECHIDIETSTKTDDRNLPSMDECANCHDIDDDENCGQCHRNPDEPIPTEPKILSIHFNHQSHINLNLDCHNCHSNIFDLDSSATSALPGKPKCMSCHDGLNAKSDCQICHTEEMNISDIHPIGWRHQHAEIANFQKKWCITCHQKESYCIDCHRGDNPTGKIHDLNYQFTHGLDARGKSVDCKRCHDQKTFCSKCHIENNRMPLNHSTLNWRMEHGSAARKDIENCASCHETDDPTCSRAGCHRDADGIRGTDARIHSINNSRFDSHGPWHDDNGYFCYNCHTNTNQAGVGFCGYCHGFED